MVGYVILNDRKYSVTVVDIDYMGDQVLVGIDNFGYYDTKAKLISSYQFIPIQEEYDVFY